MSLANYDGVLIQVAPEAPGSTVYAFVFRNTGAATLWNLCAPLREILAPLSFGLDDTHMPASLTAEDPVRIARLAPSDRVVLRRQGWGPLAAYTGPRHLRVLVSFSAHETTGPALALRARVEIGTELPPG